MAKAIEKSLKSQERRTTLTVSLSVEDKKTLKKYAVDREESISSVLHEWIKQNCKEESK